MSEENKALVRRLIKEVEKGNLDVIDEVLAPRDHAHSFAAADYYQHLSFCPR